MAPNDAQARPRVFDRVLLEPTASVLVGVGVTLALAITLAVFGTGIGVVIPLVVWLVAGTYLTLLMWCLWGERTYAGGMSWQEIHRTLSWPLGFARHVRNRAEEPLAAIEGHSWYPDRFVPDEHGKKVINERAAIYIGGTITIIGFAMLCLGVWEFATATVIILTAVLKLWATGAVVLYWLSRQYRYNLTVQTLVVLALWPIYVWVVIRVIARRRREEHSQS